MLEEKEGGQASLFRFRREGIYEVLVIKERRYRVIARDRHETLGVAGKDLGMRDHVHCPQLLSQALRGFLHFNSDRSRHVLLDEGVYVIYDRYGVYSQHQADQSYENIIKTHAVGGMRLFHLLQ